MGLDLIRALLSTTPWLRIIVITAYASIDTAVEAMRRGAKSFVQKPWDNTALLDLLHREIEDARKYGVMFSLHVKATMMKVSHPIVFGHAVRVFYKDLFDKHGKLFAELGRSIGYERALARIGVDKSEVSHQIYGAQIGSVENYKKTRPVRRYRIRGYQKRFDRLYRYDIAR